MAKVAHSAKVLSFANHKGGVGKSCSSCNVGAALSLMGKRTLLIDFDPQANLSHHLGVKSVTKSMYEVLRGEASISDITCQITENLYLAPSCLDLAGAEVELIQKIGREFLLKKAISQVEDEYDFIIIDCPPTLGFLTTNALVATNDVIIPLLPHYLSLTGIKTLRDVIEVIQSNLNESLAIGGVFISQYNSQRSLDKEVEELINNHFKDKVFHTKIRTNIKLAESAGYGRDIFRYNDKCSGAEDYKSLTKEILSKYEKN